MSHFGKEADKFVTAFLASQKNAREADFSRARSDYYDRLGVGIDPDRWDALVQEFKTANSNNSTSVPASTGDDHNMSDLPTEPLARSREVIARMETGGEKQPYQTVVSLTHKNGQKDEALGRYGILASNLPSWSEKYLGKKITRDEFLANPELQNKVFDGEFGSYLKSGKKPEEAAAMWLGGPKGLANKAADKFGSTTASYSSAFAKSFYPGRRGPTELTQTAEQPPAPKAALPILANVPVAAAPTRDTAPAATKSTLPPGFDAEEAPQEAAVPTAKPARSMDFVPLEVRDKAAAEAAGKPQAALEDEYLPDDSEFAAQGGMIGRSKEYPLHHVVSDAMRHVQTQYGLRADNGGAIQDPNYSNQVQSFLSNSRAPSSEAFDALLSRYSSEKEPIGAAMRGVYAHFANGGDVRAAQEAVAGILQGARQRAMDHGSQALEASDAGDHSAAARHLMAAYNMVPDGHSLTGEVNHNGFGKGQFINHETGAPIQQVPLNPDTIRSVAQNFSSGAGFYPHLAHAMQQGEQVKKFSGAGSVDAEGLDNGYELNDSSTADDEDRQTAYDTALADQGSAQPESAVPTQITDKAVDEQLLSRGWKSNIQPPKEPTFMPLLPEMNAGQRQAVQALNTQLANNYKIKEQEYRQQVGQELAKERIGIRQDFTKQQTEAKQQAALEKEQRQNADKEEQRKLKTIPDYAFTKNIAPVVERYNSAEGADRSAAALEIMNARAKHEEAKLKLTAKERDPAQHEAEFDEYWGRLNKVAKQDDGVKRSDGTPMTDVTKRAYYDLDKVPDAKDEFKDIMYSLMPLNQSRHSPQSIMAAVHDMAFKKSARPSFDEKSGMIKYGGVSLAMPDSTYNRILNLRNDAKARDRVNDAAAAAVREKNEAAPQQRAEAVSMRPTELSADQQYAIKYGLNPNVSPEEVDKRRSWGALQ